MKRLEGVEIFAVGTWNYQKFTREDLQDIARNTSALMAKSNHRPPLKLAHDPEQPLAGEEGDLALGWAENLRVQGDKLLADFANVPDIVAQAIDATLLRGVSVEMRYIEEFGWVLTAVALLGADLPAVKTIQDLQAYLSAPNDPGHPGDERPLRLSFSEPKLIGAPEMNDKEQQELADLRAFKASQEAKDATHKRELEDKQREIDALQGEQRKAQFAAAKTKAMAPFEERVKAGKLAPALRDEIAKAFDKQEAQFSAEAGLLVPAELSARLAEAELPSGEQARGSEPGTDPEGEPERIDYAVVREANAIRAKNPELSFSEAADLVFQTKPELGKRWLTEAPAIGKEVSA